MVTAQIRLPNHFQMPSPFLDWLALGERDVHPPVGNLPAVGAFHLQVIPGHVIMTGYVRSLAIGKYPGNRLQDSHLSQGEILSGRSINDPQCSLKKQYFTESLPRPVSAR